MAPTMSPKENSVETNCYRNVQYKKIDIQIEITKEILWKDNGNGQCINKNREKRDTYVKGECICMFVSIFKYDFTVGYLFYSKNSSTL